MTYFSDDARSGHDMVVIRRDERRRVTASPGVDLEPVIGTRLNINVVHLAPNAVAAVHSHDEEQVGYVVSGTCTFTDGERTWDLAAGDSYHAPAGAPHGATGGRDGCVIIDAFAPVRAGLQALVDEQAR